MIKLYAKNISISWQITDVGSANCKSLPITQASKANGYSRILCWYWQIANEKTANCCIPYKYCFSDVGKNVGKSIYKYIASYEACLFIFKSCSNQKQQKYKSRNPSVNNPR